jgi:hypothetical protein
MEFEVSAALFAVPFVSFPVVWARPLARCISIVSTMQEFPP